MSYPDQFEAWMAHGPDSIKGNFKKTKFTPKTWEETDVDIKIQYCGICASDLHTASSGWGATEYPIAVGHELVGEAVKVGKDVKHIKVGDTVGVGAQCSSCGKCHYCSNSETQYCSKGQVGTYNGKFYAGAAEGDRSQGGYSNYNRSPASHVVKIPDGMDPALAAPMLCGGVTVYSPLKRYGAGTKAKQVGVVGLGGLGHYAVLFAKAMGAEVTVISHSHSKEEDAKKMGASRFLATHGDDDVFKKNKRSLDLIICTTNDSRMPLDGYISLLRPHSHLVFVGLPEEKLQAPSLFPLILNNIMIGGSAIGDPSEINEMLELAHKQKIHGWIKRWNMNEVNKAVPDMHAGNARYRYVLVNQENGGKLEESSKL